MLLDTKNIYDHLWLGFLMAFKLIVYIFKHLHKMHHKHKGGVSCVGPKRGHI